MLEWATTSILGKRLHEKVYARAKSLSSAREQSNKSAIESLDILRIICHNDRLLEMMFYKETLMLTSKVNAPRYRILKLLTIYIIVLTTLTDQMIRDQ